VTDFLKSEGYDGIQDTGGKNGGREHTVWIPFSSEQVKSAEPFAKDDSGSLIPLNKRFNKKKVDIRYSHADPEVRKYLSTWAKNHVQENYDMRDELLAKYGIRPGTATLGESGRQMTRADRNRLQQIEREQNVSFCYRYRGPTETAIACLAEYGFGYAVIPWSEIQLGGYRIRKHPLPSGAYRRNIYLTTLKDQPPVGAAARFIRHLTQGS
jgi:hypothetical protein